jgi:hypothetical protein
MNNNKKESKSVTDEDTAPRRSSLHFGGIRGRSLTKAEEAAIRFPQHEDIQRMAGFALMFHGDEPPANEFPSLLASAEDERRHDDDDTQTLALSSDESEAHEDAEDRGDLRDEGRSFGYGESYGERNQ